jgi:hypothetical protein
MASPPQGSPWLIMIKRRKKKKGSNGSRSCQSFEAARNVWLAVGLVDVDGSNRCGLGLEPSIISLKFATQLAVRLEYE